MRIIGGTYRGKQIPPDPRLELRPTTDFAKEGLFNILANRYQMKGLTALDLFSGTGSISYEFISRGAAAVHAVEIDPRHASFIRSVAQKMRFTRLKVVRDDAFHFLTICKAKYDVVFADPPYSSPRIAELPDAVLRANILCPQGVFILEHSVRTDLSAHQQLTGSRHYGNVHFSFFEQP